MKKCGKLTAVILSVLLILSVLPFFAGAEGYCSRVPVGNNVNAQNYSNYAKTVKSYLTALSDGRLMRIQGAADGTVYVEYYDSSYALVGQKTVPASLPVFGAFYSCGGFFYVLSGQNNLDESDSVEVYRVTKYDASWNEIGHASLFGANTYIPFDAGSARITDCGRYLLVRTCHEMYQSSDGYHHQANVTIEIDTSTMTVTDSYTGVMNSSYGYVSHSFNQFIKVENNHIVAVDHGDAYPRSVCLLKYQTDCSSGRFVPGYYTPCSVYTMLDIYGSVGNNYTGVQVGGFEISDTSYLVTGTTVEQSENSSSIINVFVSSLNKSDNTVTVNYFTDTPSVSENPSNSRLVALGGNSFMLIWSKGDNVYYCKLNSAGAAASEIYSVSGCLSDCEPIVSGGKVVWYVYNQSEVTFYEIDIDNPSVTNNVSVDNGHIWQIGTVGENGNVELVCEKCGETKNGVLPSGVALWWAMNSYSASSTPPSPVFSGTSTVAYPYIKNYSGNSATLTDCIISSSDESVATVNYSSRGSKYKEIKWLKAGRVTISICSIYNPNLRYSYTITVRDYISEKNSGVIDRSGKFIYGITPGSASLDYFVEPYTGVTLNASGVKPVTGMSVDVIYSSTVVESYDVVIFGDVNGDGWYDGTDAMIVNCIINGLLTREQVGEAVWLAADCNHDGSIDGDDVALLEQAGVLLVSVDQTKSVEELSTDSVYQEYLSLIDQSPDVEETPAEETTDAPAGFFSMLIAFIKSIVTMMLSFIPKF